MCAAFSVEDLDGIMKRAVQRGAEVVRPVWEERDEHGVVRIAVVQTYGDTTHTLIDRTAYDGDFLPGYVPSPTIERINQILYEYPYIDQILYVKCL